MGLGGEAPRENGGLRLSDNELKTILNGTAIPTAYKMGYVLNHYREPSFRSIEAVFGITRPEIVTLIFLQHREGITSGNICEFSGHLKQNISRAVLALARKGLIRRAADHADKRRLLLYLTPAGRELHGRFMPALIAREQAMLACLTEQEHGAFTALLNRLSDHTPNWADLPMPLPQGSLKGSDQFE